MSRPKGSRNKQTKQADDAVVKSLEAEMSQPRSRTAETRAARRRRSDDIDGHRMRLAIPPQYKNDKENEYRWINDDRSRVFDLTKQDDWDQVPSDSGDDGANTVRRQVGTKPNGDPLFAHLVRKPKEFCEEDRAKKQAALDETMDQLAGGKRGDEVNIGGAAGYVATDVNIRDGRRS